MLTVRNDPAANVRFVSPVGVMFVADAACAVSPSMPITTAISVRIETPLRAGTDSRFDDFLNMLIPPDRLNARLKSASRRCLP